MSRAHGWYTIIGIENRQSWEGGRGKNLGALLAEHCFVCDVCGHVEMYSCGTPRYLGTACGGRG